MRLIDLMEAAGTINDDLFQLIQIAMLRQDGYL